MFNPNSSNPLNINNPQNNPVPNIQDQENQAMISKINLNLNSFDMRNPKGLIKQNVKNDIGLNFKIIGNNFSRNIQQPGPEKIYFLSHNLRSEFEKKNKNELKFEDYLPKFNAQKFEQITNNILKREKDFYKDFVEINGNFGINDLNIVNNISSELRKINANNPFNYMQDNPDFDFNNNKMGIYSLLQQKGIYGKIFDNKNNKLSSSFKRCNMHQRRKELKNKEIIIDKSPRKNKSFNIFSPNKSIISGARNTLSMQENQSILNSNSININKINQRKSYLIEEESNLFEKYFNSFIPYFKELIANKKINFNDKILKLRETLNININNFKEGRRNFCELLKAIITPLNNDNTIKLTTKNLIARVIKFLENDFERKLFISSQYKSFEKKDEFLSHYTNNIIYTYFSNVTSHSKSQTILLWAKIYFYLRLGWKKECINFINTIEGLYLNESGLREIKESLDDNNKIKIQNYNEFKRIINQERKEDNPFKHACMIYMAKIPEQLYNNILLEINDHLWFNLNLIYPKDNYEHLIKKENGKEDEENLLEINTNEINDEKIITLVKLKDLQAFFKNISVQELLSLNNKSTNFAYIILLVGLLKFKSALSFMIKNNMYIDAINFYMFLQQIGIYSNFDEINENIIKIPQKKYLGDNEIEEIHQIYPITSNNIPALMLYLIFSDNNFIRPLSYLLVESEAFGILNNYEKRMLLFENNPNDNNNINNISNNLIINSFNICLKDLIDEKTLRLICKKIFELLLGHEMKNNINLNPLFNVFKDLKMLTELTGILINKSIELINYKKPIITFSNSGTISINLKDNKNETLIGQSLIIKYFGVLINDVNKIFIEKQNEKENLMNNNANGRNNEKIYIIEREIDDNEINISLLKQLPIIENIYDFIHMGNFDGAFKLYMENIDIVKVGFENEEKDYINICNMFINEILKKMKYGLLGLYPDVLYLFVWLFKNKIIDFYNKGYYDYIFNLKEKSKALEILLDKLDEISKNDNILMEYRDIFVQAKNEVNQIRSFYEQNKNFI